MISPPSQPPATRGRHDQEQKLWRIAVKKFDARFACLTSALAIALAAPAAAQSPKVGDPPEAKDMRSSA
jgi:hypothetical protein